MFANEDVQKEDLAQQHDHVHRLGQHVETGGLAANPSFEATMLGHLRLFDGFTTTKKRQWD
jgi:hypothetical protein